LNRDWRHLLDHREDVFLNLRVIPQDNAESVRRDVCDLDQRTVIRAELIANFLREMTLA
jgi:hypothetical protein